MFAQSSEPEACDSLVYKTPTHCPLTGQCLSFLITNKPTKQIDCSYICQMITAKYSRQKPQGCAAKAIVSCSLQSSDHRKVLTTEAAKYSRQKPQGCAAKAIVSCSLQSSDHRKVLTTEAARMRSKSNRQLFITVERSPQSTHDRSRKDAQQKQSSVVVQSYSRAITKSKVQTHDKDAQQKQSSVFRDQGCAANA